MRSRRMSASSSRQMVRVRRLVLLAVLPLVDEETGWLWLRAGLLPPREAVDRELRRLDDVRAGS